MADGHRAAIDVEAVVRDAELLLEHQRYAAESLVDLEQVDVVDGQARFLQCLAGGVEHGGELDRSEERRVGKSVDLGGRRIIKKKKISMKDHLHSDNSSK